jgi:predicted esterase
MTFRDHFPNAKFVFPTAPLRRAVKFNRSLTRQWFDNWSLVEPELKQHLQVRGLRETATFLRELLREEIAVVGPENVALMGLSQGCAASLVTSLLWEGETFGALVGMCGYLPFRKGMLDFVEEPETEDQDPLVGSGEEDDLFERDEEGSEEAKSKLEKAVVWLREELDVPETGDESSPPILSIPIFMGHGIKDEKVPLRFGRLAVEFLRGLGPNVQWNEYEELGHWYSEDMLRDVVQFLRALKGWGDMANESSA